MTRARAEFPAANMVDLRPYAPACRAGVAALNARADMLRRRCEPFGAEELDQAARELLDLAEILDPPRAEEGP